MILRGALLASLLAVPAIAQPASGLYIAGGGGLNYLMGSRGEVQSPLFALLQPNATTARSDLRWDLGWAGLAGIGYGFGNGWRGEAEISVRSNRLDRVRIYGARAADAEGRARSVGLMANAIYDFTVQGLPVTPYLGAGLGYVWHRYDEVRGRFGPVIGEVDETAGRFAYQAIAGFSYPIGPRGLALTVEYRFLGTLWPEYELKARSALTGNQVGSGRLEVGNYDHNLLIGLRYAF